AGCRNLAHEREESIDAVARQIHGRLVEDEEAGPLESLEILDGAHGRDLGALDVAETGDLRVGRDSEVEAREGGADETSLVSPRDRAQAFGAVAPDAEVVEDGEPFDQAEVLVDEADPELAELSRSQRQLDGRAVDLEFAVWFGGVVAGEDLDQR